MYTVVLGAVLVVLPDVEAEADAVVLGAPDFVAPQALRSSAPAATATTGHREGCLRHRDRVGWSVAIAWA
ncbi:MAG: hypothetical protein ACRDF8_03420, partial [Chloroflexota bacterium]